MNNSLKQPRRCAGFTPTRHFAHKPKVRRNAQRIGALQSDQSLQVSPWGHLSSVSQKVDVPRANWKGILYIQEETGSYNPTPRIVKKEK